MKKSYFIAFTFFCSISLNAFAENNDKDVQISFVYPDFYVKSNVYHRSSPRYVNPRVPQIITGENFDSKKTKIYEWSPEGDSATIVGAIANLDKEKAQLPLTPPDDYVEVVPVNIEPQVIVADIKKEFVWVRNEGSEKYSKPYITKIVKPYWISRPEVELGSNMHIYGEGINTDKITRIIFRNSQGKYYSAIPFNDARSARSEYQYYRDARLQYFTLPKELIAGIYELYVHNGYGGVYGWVKAGDVKVTEKKPKAKVYNVVDFGAKGNGLNIDYDAILKTITTAQQNGGGVIYFPPGTYLVDQTLQIPNGISLTGSNKNNTIIKGYGFDQDIKSLTQYYAGAKMNTAYSVITMTDNTSIECLTIEGAVSKGVGGYSMIKFVPNKKSEKYETEIENISIKSCYLKCISEDISTASILYRACINTDNNLKYFDLMYSEISGALDIRAHVNRAEIIQNKFTTGTFDGIVSVWGYGENTLFDSNIFTDMNGRFSFNPTSHCYFRFNEMRGGAKGTWTNANETLLIHGGGKMTTSHPTEIANDKIIDNSQNWEPGLFKNKLVLIQYGKGFGQYRKVLDNTVNTLILEKPWNIAPDQTSEYVVGQMFSENTYFANVNSTTGMLALATACIANTIEQHRDMSAGGIELWGDDKVTKDIKTGKIINPEFNFPSYYHLIVNNWFDGSPVVVCPRIKYPSVLKGVPVFGTIIADNKIRYPFMRRTGFYTQEDVVTKGAVFFYNSLFPLKEEKRADKTMASHTIIWGNLMSYCPQGIYLYKAIDKTFIFNNNFDEVRKPIVDNGTRTICKGNKDISVGGEDNEPKNLKDY